MTMNTWESYIWTADKLSIVYIYDFHMFTVQEKILIKEPIKNLTKYI